MFIIYSNINKFEKLIIFLSLYDNIYSIIHNMSKDIFDNITNILKIIKMSEKKFYKKNIKILLEDTSLTQEGIFVILDYICKFHSEIIEKLYTFKFTLKYYISCDNNEENNIKEFENEVYNYGYKLLDDMNKFNFKFILDNSCISIDKENKIKNLLDMIKFFKFFEKIKFKNILNSISNTDINESIIIKKIIFIHKEIIRKTDKYEFILKYYKKIDVDYDILSIFESRILSYIDFILEIIDDIN